MNTTTAKEAKVKGYRPLTTGYELPKEQWMLDNVLADMQNGNIDAVLVQTKEEGKDVVEVWRRAPHSA